jgi:protein MAK11
MTCLFLIGGLMQKKKKDKMEDKMDVEELLDAPIQEEEDTMDQSKTLHKTSNPHLPKYFEKLEIVVIAGTIDSTLCGWKFNQTTLEPMFAQKFHSGTIHCLTTKHSYLYTGGHDENIHVFDIRTKNQMGTIPVIKGSILTIAPFRTSHIFVGTSLGNLIGFSTNRFFDKIMDIPAHKGKVLSVSIHPSGKAALTTGDDRKLKLWNLTKGSCDFSTRMRTVCDQVSWSPNGDTFAYIKGNDVMIYSQTLELIAKLSHEKPVNTFTYLGESLVVTGGENNSICIYDIANEELLHKIEDVHSNRIKGLFSLPISHNDEYLLASGDSNGGIALWKIQNDSVVLLDYVESNARITTVGICVPLLSSAMKK